MVEIDYLQRNSIKLRIQTRSKADMALKVTRVVQLANSAVRRFVLLISLGILKTNQVQLSIHW